MATQSTNLRGLLLQTRSVDGPSPGNPSVESKSNVRAHRDQTCHRGTEAWQSRSGQRTEVKQDHNRQRRTQLEHQRRHRGKQERRNKSGRSQAAKSMPRMEDRRIASRVGSSAGFHLVGMKPKTTKSPTYNAQGGQTGKKSRQGSG